MLPPVAAFAKLVRAMFPRFLSDRRLVGLFLVACVLAGLGLGARRELGNVASALEQRHALQLRVDRLLGLRRTLAEAELVHAKYLTGPGADSLDPYEDKCERARAQLQALQVAYAQSPGPRELLGRIDTLLARQHGQWETGPRPAAHANGLSVLGASGGTLHAQLDGLFSELEQVQRRELNASIAATQAHTRSLMQRIGWAVAAGVLVVLALGVLYARDRRDRAQRRHAAQAQRVPEQADPPLQRANRLQPPAADVPPTQAALPRHGLGSEGSDVRRRLQDIISSIRDGFVTLDRNWNYTYVNDAAARLLGRGREELIGHNIWALFPEIRRLPFHDACMRCVQQREPVQVDQYYAPQFRWYRNHLYPTDGGLAIFFEDFTARKRLEAQLADERERYRATFEQPAIGILHVALEGAITRSNERMASMLGYDRQDLVGMDFARILADTHARAFLDQVQHPSRGGTSRLVQCRFRRRNGEPFWGEMTLALVPGEAERCGYVVCMVQDIGDRKRAESLLEESRLRLSVFAQQLTEAVEQERARISREIHDELGQALTRLKMDLGWLRRRLAENGHGAGPVAERAVEMGRFIDETLVSVRRLATELRPALLDNLGLAAALHAQMRQIAAQADIEVTQHLEPDLPLSSEQATGLYRIAQEALTNIVRHASASSVRCVLFLDQGGVTMEIQDDGCGFDVGMQPEHGLGLLGMAERARLLGGFSAVESEPGRGTLVRVHLPVTQSPRDST